MDARRKVLRSHVHLVKVAVRLGDQVPDSGKDDPSHEEAAHEGQKRVPEKVIPLKTFLKATTHLTFHTRQNPEQCDQILIFL